MARTHRQPILKLDGVTGEDLLPDQPGSPDGRPRGRPLTALLRQRLDEVEPESGRTYGQLVIDGWLSAAMGGNASALKEVLDRAEGKVSDKVQVDDLRKAYVTESPDTLWPPDPNSDRTSPGAPPAPSGETAAPSCS